MVSTLQGAIINGKRADLSAQGMDAVGFQVQFLELRQVRRQGFHLLPGDYSREGEKCDTKNDQGGVCLFLCVMCCMMCLRTTIRGLSIHPNCGFVGLLQMSQEKHKKREDKETRQQKNGRQSSSFS